MKSASGYLCTSFVQADHISWHADIKPDNILRVHGEFKLADFGFARFSRMTDGNNEVPERLIDGGTDAFSA